MDMKKKNIKANSLDNKLIVMSNIIARKTPLSKKKEPFTQTEQKLFYMALSQANTIDDKGVVKLLKKDVFEKLGVSDNDKYGRYREIFKSMRFKTYYEFDKEDGWADGFLIYQTVMTRNYFHLYFAMDYIELLQKLDKATTMYFDDIMRFDCKHSAPLYQRLRSLNEHPIFKNYYDFTTKELKEVFGLSVDDYVKKKGAQAGKFDRTNFEKQTINKAVEELNEKATLVKNVRVEKHKKGNQVAFYRVYFENQKLVSLKDLDENAVPGQTNIEDFIEVEPERNSTFGYYYSDVHNVLDQYALFTNDEIDVIFLMARNIVMKSMDFEYMMPGMVQIEIEVEALKFLNRLAMQLKVNNGINNKYKYLIGVLEKKEKQIMQGDGQDD